MDFHLTQHILISKYLYGFYVTKHLNIYIPIRLYMTSLASSSLGGKAKLKPIPAPKIPDYIDDAHLN
jgi:hypothetical protein